MRPFEVPLRYAVGVDKIMWGCDYPHRETSFPYSREALRLAYADIDPTEVRAMVGGNAAALYGFDLDRLAPVAAPRGPTVDEIARPLPPDAIPDDAPRHPPLAAPPTPRPSPIAPPT